MAVKKITKRWMFNSLGVIVVILLVLVVAFSFGIRSFYYSSVRNVIQTRSSSIMTLLERSALDSSTSFSVEVQRTVGNFEDKSRMELMAIDVDGNVLITSSGFESEERLFMPDFEEAMSSGSGYFQGELGGENIMAYSVASKVVDENLAAIRLVVSLERVDAQIVLLIAIVTLVGMAILFFVILSSSYFISSIVNPVGEVGQTARKIAQGDFDVRLEKKNDDEIGDLCDIINYMAEELSNAERLKNDFISSVSHELRTPLTAIKGWGETMLYDKDTDPDTTRKGLQVILRETDRLSDMVEELLDFSRMQSGRLKLVMSKMDALAELGEAVLMYTERARREGMTLIYDEPEFFAPVFGDRNRLRQVFINIIDNALKYSDPGDTITVTAQLMEGNIVITVADTGCGISEKDLPKIKNKFYKANLTRRGSGIGLAVADEIVVMHGGRLDVASTEGVGTTVTIIIPLTTKKAEETRISQAQSAAAAPPEEE